MIKITPTGQACGAVVTGLELAAGLTPSEVATLRNAWLEHHILVFPDQPLSDDQYEQFVEYFGPIGTDPFIAPAPGKKHIAEVRRDADETSKPFAETWHSDWSFMTTPPAGTCLHAVIVPPKGGDTLFVNEHKVLENLPPELQQRLKDKIGIHSAKWAYADDGYYADDKYNGSMNIRTSNEAKTEFGHPLVRHHPETDKLGLFGGTYVTGIETLSDDESTELMRELNTWLAKPEFQYRHKWQPDMLIMWDNRSVLHRALGGYDGHARLLHRLTVSDDPGRYLS